MDISSLKQNILIKLKTKNINIKSDLLHSLVLCYTDPQNLPHCFSINTDYIFESVFWNLLFSDFTSCLLPSLPSHFLSVRSDPTFSSSESLSDNNHYSGRLDGVYVLQILSFQDIANPSRSSENRSHSLFTFYLTDGSRALKAFEYEDCPVLRNDQIKIGSKIAIKDALVHLGVILLQRNTVSFLGGALQQTESNGIDGNQESNVESVENMNSIKNEDIEDVICFE